MRLQQLHCHSLPDHATEDDVSLSVERFEIDNIFSHLSVRGRGGVIAVVYEKRWKTPSTTILRTRTGASSLSPTRYPRLDRRTPAESADKSVKTAACASVPLRSTSLATRAPVFYRPATTTATVKLELTGSVATFSPSALTSDRGESHLGWFGNISAHTHFLNDLGPVKLVLSSARYIAALDTARGAWCLQVHQGHQGSPHA